MNWNEWIPPLDWQLTPLEARVFAVLLQRRHATHDQLIEAAYWDREEPRTVERCLWVMVHKIRVKLGKKLGIEVVRYPLTYKAYCIQPDARRREIKAEQELRDREQTGVARPFG